MHAILYRHSVHAHARTRDGVNFPMDAVAFLAIPRACVTSCFSSSFVWAGGRGTVERGPPSNSYVAHETQLQLKPTFYSATFDALSDVLESLIFVFCYAFLPLGIPFLKLVLKWILKIQTVHHLKRLGDQIKALPALSGTSNTQSSFGSSVLLYPHLGFHS